jgi:hypothetical protein
MQQRLAHDRHRSSLPRRLLRRFSTAAATKQIPTAILDGFSVYSGGRMEIKFHSPSLLFSVTRSSSHHFIRYVLPLSSLSRHHLCITSSPRQDPLF